MNLGVVIRAVVIVAALVGIAMWVRASGSRWGSAPGAVRRRGFARTHPWTLLLIVVVTLVVVTVGPYVMFIGGMWLACRGGGGSC